MDYRTIAYALLSKTEEDGLLLTQQQIDYLALKISELPQSQAIQLERFSEEASYPKDIVQDIIDTLRGDDRLIFIMNLGTMSTVDLIDSLAYIMSGLFRTSIERISETEHRLVFECINSEDDQGTQADPQIPENIPTCPLQKLFGAAIAQKSNYEQEEAYAEAIRIFQTEQSSSEPVLLSKEICYTLEQAEIKTNADLIRWYKEASKTPWCVPHLGHPHLGKVQFRKIGTYLDFWLSRERQKLLINTALH